MALPESYYNSDPVLEARESQFFIHRNSSDHLSILVVHKQHGGGKLMVVAISPYFGYYMSMDQATPVPVEKIDKKFNPAVVLYSIAKNNEYLVDIFNEVSGRTQCLCTQNMGGGK